MSEQSYLDLLARILEEGSLRGDRTGTGTLGVFGPQLRFDLGHGFPALTTKRLFWRGVTTELLWFLQGRTDKRWLTDRDVHIWDEWSAPGHPGHIGPGYGWQWRSAGAPYDPRHAPGWARSERGTDQLADVLDSLRHDPTSRRHLVSAWDPSHVNEMALPPCHTLFQFHVADDRLSCQLYQRSADMFLGVPFNIASYALLTHVVAREVGLGVGEFVWTAGDAHIYSNHVDAVREQLTREPLRLPDLVVRGAHRHPGDILPNHEPEDFLLVGYDPHPTISAPVAV